MLKHCMGGPRDKARSIRFYRLKHSVFFNIFVCQLANNLTVIHHIQSLITRLPLQCHINVGNPPFHTVMQTKTIVLCADYYENCTIQSVL